MKAHANDIAVDCERSEGSAGFDSCLSCSGPLIVRDTGVAQDSPNEPGIDRAPVGIGNRQAQTPSTHPLVPASRERPFEAQAS